MAKGNSKSTAPPRGKASLRLRLDFGGGRSLGPGKIHLLELIHETGSISAAARAQKMSYRQAWLLVDELNRMFGQPVVSAQTGGGGGGGTVVTEAGNAIVQLYRDLERRATVASTMEIRALARRIAPTSAR